VGRCAALHGMRCNALRAGWLHSRGALRCARAGCIRAVRCAARDAMQCAARGLVAVAGAGGAMLLTMVLSLRAVDGWAVCEVWVDRWAEGWVGGRMGGGMDIRGVYRFSSLMK
jgi:hypothetical protein